MVREGYPDFTQFDPSSEYFDPKSKEENPRWIMVDVQLDAIFPRLVSLNELRDDPALDGMVVTQKGSRLSVQPVDPVHFKHVLRAAEKPAPADI